jgi:hypothetical protein
LGIERLLAVLFVELFQVGVQHSAPFDVPMGGSGGGLHGAGDLCQALRAAAIDQKRDDRDQRGQGRAQA